MFSILSFILSQNMCKLRRKLRNAKIYPLYVPILQIINRPGVAGAVLQSPPLLTYLLIKSAFSSRYSQHHKSQTVRAGQLKFWENVHTTPCGMCHVSGVTCQVSPVTCHVSRVTCHMSKIFFFTFSLEKKKKKKKNIYIYFFFL